MDFNVNETLSLLHYGKNLNIVMSWGLVILLQSTKKTI